MKTKRIQKPFFHTKIKENFIEIYNTDALTFLKNTPSKTSDIVFIDPPFNIGKDYMIQNFDDRKNPHQYTEWLTQIVDESIRIMKNGSSLYFYHLPSMAYKIANILEAKLSFRHWIAVSMKNNFARGKRLYPAHYALLYFTLGEPSVFKRPKTEPKRCRHCGKFIKDYGGYRHIIEAKGVNLSDFWEDLSPVRHKSTKTRPQNELPLEFFNRMFEISAAYGGTYVDPFIGSGGGILEATRHGMNTLGCDASSISCRIASERIDPNALSEKPLD